MTNGQNVKFKIKTGPQKFNWIFIIFEITRKIK